VVVGRAQRLRDWRLSLRFHYLVMVLILAIGAPAAGHNRTLQQDEFDPAVLRFEEGFYLGQKVTDVVVKTANGTQSLAELIRARPTILALTYFTCGGACPLTIRNLSQVVSTSTLPEHQVIILSFDAKDTLTTLSNTRSALKPVPRNWTFGLLSGEESSRLTESVGFRFFFSERDQAFLHPAMLVFLSPEGKVMRYLYGTEPRAQDIELALIESRNRVPHLNELIDVVKLTCFQFDASRSRYRLHPTLIFGGAGIGVLGVAGLVALAFKRDSKGG